MKRQPTLVLLCLLLPVFIINGQRKTLHQDQYWVGYMTSATLSQRYSLWTDVHIVPASFAIARMGLSRNIFPRGTLTGGYAFLLLPAGINNHLRRQEHRPWAQFQFILPVRHALTVTQRIRYDARFRQHLSEREPDDGYGFNHRVRFLMSLKKDLTSSQRLAFKPYVVVSNELLLNFGKEITNNTFDQNRLSLSVGIGKEKIQYQLGLMNRFVQTGPSTFILNHTVVIWVIQKFDLRKAGKIS
jgi:hypothetical protein